MAEVNATSQGKFLALSATCGLLGTAGVALGLFVSPTRTLFAYLIAFVFATSICVGALFLLMIGYAANAAWMSVIRRLCEALALGVVPLAVLFAPIAFGLSRLYLWADASADLSAETRALLAHKAPYLNQVSFVLRSLVYFAVWIVSSVLLHRWSRKRDGRQADSTGPDALGKERRFASVMLVFVSLATTFAAFDWLMSLTPTWYSSMYGVYFFAGGFLAAISLVSVLAHFLAQRTTLRVVMTKHHFHALGRLLFAFTIFWAYAAYFQVFLISIADKPSEVTFYLARMHGSWRLVSYALALGHFAVPFLLLLPKSWKFSSWYVASLAGWLLLMHWLDIVWLVLPVHAPQGLALHWTDMAAISGIGGISLAVCLAFQRRAPLVAGGDPLLAQGVQYASHA